jgi:TRAP-type C4-dicarboxylate transport system permease small subunit
MLAKIARGADRVVGALSGLAVALAAVATLGCLALVCYAVILRYFFGRPLSWTDEAGGFLVVLLVMLAVAEAQRRGEHIGVDLLLERSRDRFRRILRAFGAACVAAASAVLLWQGWETVAFSRMIGARPLVIAEIPLWAIEMFLPIGAALMLLVSLAQLLALAAGTAPEFEQPEIPKATE